MAELTLIIHNWGHIELKSYLMTLKGILDVNIKNENYLEIYIKYNPNLTNTKTIKIEVFLFLGILKTPSIISFDKHSSFKTLEYIIIKNDSCCEYCFKSSIEYLYELEGIDKVETNIDIEQYYYKNHDKRNTIIIKIRYNPDVITIKNLKNIETTLNI